MYGDTRYQTVHVLLTIMYQSQGPYKICKAPRAVRPEGFSNLICPEGLVHNCFRIPLQNIFYSIKLKFGLNKLKSRLCIDLTLSIDLDPDIFLVYFGGNDFK